MAVCLQPLYSPLPNLADICVANAKPEPALMDTDLNTSFKRRYIKRGTEVSGGVNGDDC